MDMPVWVLQGVRGRLRSHCNQQCMRPLAAATVSAAALATAPEPATSVTVTTFAAAALTTATLATVPFPAAAQFATQSTAALALATLAATHAAISASPYLDLRVGRSFLVQQLRE